MPGFILDLPLILTLMNADAHKLRRADFSPPRRPARNRWPTNSRLCHRHVASFHAKTNAL